MEELIKQLREQRAELAKRLEEIPAKALEEERPKLSAEEQSEFDSVRDDVKALDKRISELVDAFERQTKADEAAAKVDRGGKVRVGAEPLTYERGKFDTSYTRDIAMAVLRQDAGAWERLRRHSEEVKVEAERLSREGKLGPEYRDISRTDTAGGEFVPPLWLIEDFAVLARAGRVTADLIPTRPLPPGTDSINVPRITTGSTVATQTDNAAVSETDLVTTSVAAAVNTIAGQQDASLQLVEQSPVGMDDVIFADLMSDYAEQLDVQVLNGNGTAPNHRGILNVASIEAVTYTDATPTVAEAYPKFADAIFARVGALRFKPAEVVVMHPRRWGWIMAGVDSQNRPLAVPNPAYGGFNPIAVQSQVAAEGVAGTIQGVPVHLDANLPTNLGAGTNEDIVIVARVSDMRLWEGALRTRVLQEVLSGTLAVRFQLYAYSAFMAGRYPKAIATIGGTGLAAPTF